jgi:hypothetical protein
MNCMCFSLTATRFGTRITPDVRVAFFDRERAKPAWFDPIATRQGGRDFVENCGDGFRHAA